MLKQSHPPGFDDSITFSEEYKLWSSSLSWCFIKLWIWFYGAVLS